MRHALEHRFLEFAEVPHFCGGRQAARASFTFRLIGSAIDQSGLARLRWRVGPADGPAAMTGTDVAQFQDERIVSLHILLDPSPSAWRPHPMEVSINVHHPDGQVEVLGPAQIREQATALGLEALVPGRYSSLLVLNLLTLAHQGVDPRPVLHEIEVLEGQRSAVGTKPATPYRGALLKGLWHKHFFVSTPSAMAHNILNHFGEQGLGKMVDEVMSASSSPVFTPEMLQEIIHRATVEPYEQRHAAGKLTGEWLVFGKHEDVNYYLCVATHDTEDAQIADQVRVCQEEFDGVRWLTKHPSMP